MLHFWIGINGDGVRVYRTWKHPQINCMNIKNVFPKVWTTDSSWLRRSDQILSAQKSSPEILTGNPNRKSWPEIVTGSPLSPWPPLPLGIGGPVASLKNGHKIPKLDFFKGVRNCIKWHKNMFLDVFCVFYVFLCVFMCFLNHFKWFQFFRDINHFFWFFFFHFFHFFLTILWCVSLLDGHQ